MQVEISPTLMGDATWEVVRYGESLEDRVVLASGHATTPEDASRAAWSARDAVARLSGGAA